jgi:predicted MFS family arabinose efflux permease
MTGLRAALRVREFAALLISYVINQVGDVVGSLALAVIVFAATRSALATAALFLATQFLPGLIGPSLIARVDRLAPGRLLPVLYAIEGGLFLLLALTVGHLGLGPIVALAFLDGTLAFIARTMTRTAAASSLIPHGLMPEGKAAFNVGLAVATIAGPGIAAVAIAVLGAPSALVADAVSFLVAAVLLARAAPPRPAAEDDPPSAPYSGRLRESLRYMAREATLRALIAGEGLAFVFFYLVEPVAVVYATKSLHAGASGYAALLGAWGVGIAIGSAAHVRLARRIGTPMILLSTLAVAAGYIGTAAAPTLLLAASASVVGGIGNGTQWASVETAIHQLVEEQFRARVAAVVEALACVAPGVGILLGGTLATLLSPRAAYAAAGLGLVALVAFAALSRVSLGPGFPQPIPQTE